MAGIANAFQGFLLNQSASRLANALPGIEHVTGQSECAASKAQLQHCQLDVLARHNHALKKEDCAFQQEIATKNKCAFTANEVAKVEHAKELAIELAEWKPEYQEKHTGSRQVLANRKRKLDESNQVARKAGRLRNMSTILLRITTLRNTEYVDTKGEMQVLLWKRGLVCKVIPIPSANCPSR